MIPGPIARWHRQMRATIRFRVYICPFLEPRGFPPFLTGGSSATSPISSSLTLRRMTAGMPFLVIQTREPVFSTSITSAVRIAFALDTFTNFTLSPPFLGMVNILDYFIDHVKRETSTSQFTSQPLVSWQYDNRFFEHHGINNPEALSPATARTTGRRWEQIAW